MKQTLGKPTVWSPVEAAAFDRIDAALTFIKQEMGKRIPLRRISLLIAIHAKPGLSIGDAVASGLAPEKTIRFDLAALGASDSVGKAGLDFIYQRWDHQGSRARLTYELTPRGMSFIRRLACIIDP